MQEAKQLRKSPLKARKSTMAPEQYAAELEALLTELARVTQQIRAKT